MHLRPVRAIIGSMNVRFVVRGTLLALIVVLLVAATVVLVNGPGRIFLPPDATPPHPIITVPRGLLPTSPVGLIEWTRYGAEPYRPVARGFLLRLANGDRVGITTAHSISFAAVPPLQGVALVIGGHSAPVFVFDTLRGEPGIARTGEDMTVDYVLLDVPRDAPIDPALVIEPDPRGLPQPGERVSMYTVLGNGPRVLTGTVQTAADQAVWVLMDDDFDPSGLSGSPFVSQYTGKVVGMAIATTRRGGKVLLGLHPIGSLVQRAEAAKTFLKIADFRR